MNFEDKIINLGANNVSLVDIKNISFSESFRTLCEMNSCGMYNKSWMCPPSIGNINDLIDEAKTYDYAVVYNTIHKIKDSFDVEGMYGAGDRHNTLTNKINNCLQSEKIDYLHLSAGGCHICKKCSKVDGKPCIYPERAIAPVEAYGIDVSNLAIQSGLKYINGQNTVTYFGAILIKDSNKSKIYINNSEIIVKKGTLVSEAISSIDDNTDIFSCGGKGICGKCKVSAEGNLSSIRSSEKNLLIEDEIKRGIRLACKTKILGECKIKYKNNNNQSKIKSSSNKITEINNPIFEKYGVAIDIGTTTMAFSFFDKYKKLCSKTCKNPQILFGADVMTRISASIDGKSDSLQKVLINKINNIINEFTKENSISNDNIDAIVITGNTAMLYGLINRDMTSLSHAPFEADYLFDTYITPGSVGISINENAKIYIPPCLSSFLGSDIFNAIHVSKIIDDKDKNNLLVDIGTNGELALWNGKKLICCSTAAGPAFEGAEIHCGLNGVDGAIDSFYIENGDIKYTTILNKEPIGICGSGVVDIVSCLKNEKMISKTGQYNIEKLNKFNRLEYTNKDISYKIYNDIVFTQTDIRKVQLAKSAIWAGINTLLNTAELEYEDIDNLYIAGGFGSFLNIENAANIGLIPIELKDKTYAIGNAALDGAEEILCSGISNKESIINNLEVLNLAKSPIFMDYYIEGMEI